MNKQGQPHWAPFGRESLVSRKEFDWQPWNWAPFLQRRTSLTWSISPLLQSTFRVLQISCLSMLVPPPPTVSLVIFDCHWRSSVPRPLLTSSLTSHSPVSPSGVLSSLGLISSSARLWLMSLPAYWSFHLSSSTSSLIALANTFSLQTQLRKDLIWEASLGGGGQERFFPASMKPGT